MSDDELRAFVKRIRTVVSSPPTLSSELDRDSNALSPKRPKSEAAIKKAIATQKLLDME